MAKRRNFSAAFKAKVALEALRGRAAGFWLWQRFMTAAGARMGRGSAASGSRSSYTVSPAGQRLKRSRAAMGVARAVGRHKKAPPG